MASFAGIGGELVRPLLDRVGHRPRVFLHAERIAETLRLVRVLAVLDGARLERHAEELEHPPHLGLGVLHELLVADADERHGSLAEKRAIAGT